MPCAAYPAVLGRSRQPPHTWATSICAGYRRRMDPSAQASGPSSVSTRPAARWSKVATGESFADACVSGCTPFLQKEKVPVEEVCLRRHPRDGGPASARTGWTYFGGVHAALFGYVSGRRSCLNVDSLFLRVSLRASRRLPGVRFRILHPEPLLAFALLAFASAQPHLIESLSRSPTIPFPQGSKQEERRGSQVGERGCAPPPPRPRLPPCRRCLGGAVRRLHLQKRRQRRAASLRLLLRP